PIKRALHFDAHERYPPDHGRIDGLPPFSGYHFKGVGEKLDRLRRLGLKDVIIDPGFGFAKTPDQNFGLLAYLSLFRELGCPILVGVSRKSTITRTLGIPTEEALNGTTVLNTIALMNGASILRVHDVLEAKQAIVLTECVKKFDE
ncbi:MAG: dihydropteroate synthase, partial [Spirosomataceae bacterium]